MKRYVHVGLRCETYDGVRCLKHPQEKPTPSRAVLWVLITSLTAPGQAATDPAKRSSETGLTLIEAIAKAQALAGDGVAFHAELEAQDGAAVYSIDFAQGIRTCNVVLGGKDGRVIENKVENGDQSAAVGACGITLTAAIGSASNTSITRPESA